MPNSEYFFFVDANQQASSPTASINAQTSGAYGPISPGTADTDEYRVTSLHTATFNPTAYAVCDGIVCVQRIPNTSPLLVNIILKPLVQPALNFAPVKYIFYKGILESSLINGAETAAAVNNRLTQFIWEEQAKKNKSAGTNVNPPAEALGVGLTGTNFAAADPIDNLFYRTGVSFQLPGVKGGWSIGQFDKNGFGMEVLMEGLAFHHPLSLARQLENKISVLTLTGSETPAELFDHWHAKEQVLGFMDPCAFYGSFFLVGIQAKTSSDTEFKLRAGNALYNDVLFAFANRNTAYLDIRNEHNFSFNYFTNYDKYIQLSCDLANAIPTPVDYYVSKWPLLTLPASSFPITNTNKARNAFRIQLPVGDNAEPLLYVSQGYRDINRKRKGFPAELKSAERFYDAFETPVGGFTATKDKSGLTSMAFVVPNVTGQAAATPVSCYIRLKYLKQQQQGATAIQPAIQSANYLDNLVYPLDLRVLPSGNANIKTSVYEEEVYVNAQNVAGLQCDFIAKVGIARDAKNTSLWVIPTTVRTSESQASALVTLSGETSDTPESYSNVIASKYPPERIRRSDLVLSSGTVPVAEFVSDGDAAEAAKFAVPDFSKLLVFMVANATYDSWKTKMAAGAVLDNRFRTYLGIKNLQAQTDTVGVSYTSFDLVLRGFALDATTGNYKVQEMNTDPADSAANVTVYASAPEGVTCSITSDADGMSTACISVGGIIQLKAVPSSGSGTYQWSTTSTKITLNNTATQTVMVQAKNQVSASRGAETVQLVFTPTEGASLPPITRDVTVIKVAFSESANQSYGYDDMDNVAGFPQHVSVKRGGFTKVDVAVLGGGTADDLEFVSDDITIAEPVPPAAGSGASFDLTIEGKNQLKAETSIRAVCKGGPICATIKVNVYKEVVLLAKVAKIYDSTSSGTTLSFPHLDMPTTETRINTAYKSAVVVIHIEDASPTGDALDVKYDLDVTGTLTLGADGGGPEIDQIKLDRGIGSDREVVPTPIIIVREIDFVYFLAKQALAGESTIYVKGGTGIFLSHIKDGDTYSLGLGSGAEMVKVLSRDYQNGIDLDGDGSFDGYPFTLSAPLANAHPVSDGIVRKIGGVRTFPIVAQEALSDEVTRWVIGHEIGHLPRFGWLDLQDPTNLMNENANFTDHKLRFDQWESVNRD